MDASGNTSKQMNTEESSNYNRVGRSQKKESSLIINDVIDFKVDINEKPIK